MRSWTSPTVIAVSSMRATGKASPGAPVPAECVAFLSRSFLAHPPPAEKAAKTATRGKARDPVRGDMPQTLHGSGRLATTTATAVRRQRGPQRGGVSPLVQPASRLAQDPVNEVRGHRRGGYRGGGRR